MYVLPVFDVSFIIPYLLICDSCTASANILYSSKSFTSICVVLLQMYECFDS